MPGKTTQSLKTAQNLKREGNEERSLRRNAETLHDALSQLIRLYQFRDRDRICCHGLSVSQCYALETVIRRDGCTVNDVSGELLLEKSTVSRVLGELEGKGLVARRTHPDDGRALLLEATREGRELHHVIREEILEQEEEILSRFSPETQEELPRFLRSLARAAGERVEAVGGRCRVR